MTFDAPAAVKDVIEGLGVPHPEVDLILANGVPVPFAYQVRPGDRVSVYPRFFALDAGEVSLVRPPPAGEPRFVLDTHLGRLAAYLRLAGFDTIYGHGWDDARLAELSQREKRILLTRDVGLLKRGAVLYGHFVRETHPRRQFAELVEHYDLSDDARPFTRCLRCNGEIAAVSKAVVLGQVPPRARDRHDEFWRCLGCGRVYWKGSHYEWMRRLLDAELTPSRAPRMT